MVDFYNELEGYMSAWTYANVVIKGQFAQIVTKKEALDYLKKVIGKELRCEDSSKYELEYAFNHEDEYLPLGSDGSLEAAYSYDFLTMAYEIRVSGNLTNVQNGDKIMYWFHKVTNILTPSFAYIETSSTDDDYGYKKIECKRPYSVTIIKN